VARGTTDLRRSDATAANETFVVKATHAGGVIKLFTCLLAYDFQCTMLMPEGTARGLLPLQTGTADIIFGSSSVPATPGAPVQHGFVGALEELQFNRISKENVTAHLFNEPGSGCTNYYIWDFTRPAARTHWAKSIADVYNTVRPVASQWDGSEFQIALNPWGLPHSSRTLGQDRNEYFLRATMEAFMESHKLWNEPVAVEFSFSPSGLGPWSGDMTPFADEGRIKPSADLCDAGNGGVTDGNGWHMEMLEKMMLSGTTYNAYSTPIVWLKTPNGADCWLGKLVATGMAPQVSGCHYSIPLSPSQHAICDPVVPRVKFWLELFREFGAATESSVQLLHEKIFFVGLEGGTDQSVAHFSVYVGNTTQAMIPPVPNNSTLIVCQSFGVPFANLSLPGGGNTALNMFAASNTTIFMSGGFWTLNNANMLETITSVDGTHSSHRWVFPLKVSGAQRHLVELKVRERVSYTVGPGPVALKLDGSELSFEITSSSVNDPIKSKTFEVSAVEGAPPNANWLLMETVAGPQFSGLPFGAAADRPPPHCEWWQATYHHFSYSGTCVTHGTPCAGTAIPGDTMNNKCEPRGSELRVSTNFMGLASLELAGDWYFL
jgi:hypothetical protein